MSAARLVPRKRARLLERGSAPLRGAKMEVNCFFIFGLPFLLCFLPVLPADFALAVRGQAESFPLSSSNQQRGLFHERTQDSGGSSARVSLRGLEGGIGGQGGSW